MENTSHTLGMGKWRWSLFFGLYWPLQNVAWILSGIFRQIFGSGLFLGNVCPCLT